MQAPDPPRARWCRWWLRRRRSRRLPAHSNDVGSAFQPRAVASSQSMMSSGDLGVSPARARRTRMRWIDSAMFSQEPLNGVWRGMTPWATSHSTSAGVLWPLRLSRTSSIRSGGKRSGRVTLIASPACQRSQIARRSAAGWTGGSGSVVRIAVSSVWSQGCSTALAALVTPVTRTRPEAGWNRVSRLAVPWRMCAWGSRAGPVAGRQWVPGCGIAWYGPASSSVQTGSSVWVYACSISPFLPSRPDRGPRPRRACAAASPARCGTTSGPVASSGRPRAARTRWCTC